MNTWIYEYKRVQKNNILNFTKLLIWIRDIIYEKGFYASIIGRLQNDTMIQAFFVHIYLTTIFQWNLPLRKLWKPNWNQSF
jgi:hypothetical protein